MKILTSKDLAIRAMLRSILFTMSPVSNDPMPMKVRPVKLKIKASVNTYGRRV